MVEPYYQDDLVTLYLGDCLELDAWLEADVLVTDPPYGMDYSGFGGRAGEPRRDEGRLAIEGDLSTDVRDAALAAWDQGGGARPALVFGTWRLPRPAGTRHLIVWDKGDGPGMGDLTMPWGHSHEDVYVMGEGFRVPDGGKRLPNVVRVPTVPISAMEREHPTPKPLALMEHLIERCPPGVIADPFAGSGSTLRAAKNLGRHAVGIERDASYCDLIARRLAQGALDFGGAA